MRKLKSRKVRKQVLNHTVAESAFTLSLILEPAPLNTIAEDSSKEYRKREEEVTVKSQDKPFSLAQRK